MFELFHLVLRTQMFSYSTSFIDSHYAVHEARDNFLLLHITHLRPSLSFLTLRPQAATVAHIAGREHCNMKTQYGLLTLQSSW